MEPPGPIDDQYINAAKASELLRIGYKTMLRWIKAGRVQAIERRYDYDNAEFLIPLEEVERLRAALTMSLREVTTRFLKLELDAQSLARRLMYAEGQILSLRTDLAQLQRLVSVRLGESLEVVADNQVGVETDVGAQRLSLEPLHPGDQGIFNDPPPGSVRLTVFLREHGIATTTGLDHLTRAQIEPLLLDRGAKDHSKERWLSPELQGRLVVFWESASKPYTLCPDCPHYEVSTEIPEVREGEDEGGDQQPDQER